MLLWDRVKVRIWHLALPFFPEICCKALVLLCICWGHWGWLLLGHNSAGWWGMNSNVDPSPIGRCRGVAGTRVGGLMGEMGIKYVMSTHTQIWNQTYIQVLALSFLLEMEVMFVHNNQSDMCYDHMFFSFFYNKLYLTSNTITRGKCRGQRRHYCTEVTFPSCATLCCSSPKLHWCARIVTVWKRERRENS